MMFCRTINAFLNTGNGGTVYLGVIDSGEVRGLKLTQYQVCLIMVATVHFDFFLEQLFESLYFRQVL